jgi:hypothetical protein
MRTTGLLALLSVAADASFVLLEPEAFRPRFVEVRNL